MRLPVAILLMAMRAAAGADQKPSAEEQARKLEQVREAALNYSRSLPDFICTQVVKRYVDATGRDRWTPIDTLTVKLSYFGQKEDYKLLSIDNKPTNLEYMKAGGASSKGEFGTVLYMVFSPKSATEFQWNSWTFESGGRQSIAIACRARIPVCSERAMDRGQSRETLVGFHGESSPIARPTWCCTRRPWRSLSGFSGKAGGDDSGLRLHRSGRAGIPVAAQGRGGDVDTGYTPGQRRVSFVSSFSRRRRFVWHGRGQAQVEAPGSVGACTGCCDDSR